jgi:hypothetical protein
MRGLSYPLAGDASPPFSKFHFESAADKIALFCFRAIRRRYETVTMRVHQDEDYRWLLCLIGLLLVVLVEVAVKESGRSMFRLVYLIVTLLFSFWSLAKYLALGTYFPVMWTHRSDAAYRGYTSDTGAWSWVTGRASVFYGSGYNTTERVVLQRVYLAQCRIQFPSLTPTVYTANTIISWLSQTHEDEMRVHIDLGQFARVKYLEYAFQRVAEWYVQSLEAKVQFQVARTSNLTRNKFMDQDFGMRGSWNQSRFSAIFTRGPAPPRHLIK